MLACARHVTLSRVHNFLRRHLRKTVTPSIAVTSLSRNFGRADIWMPSSGTAQDASQLSETLNRVGPGCRTVNTSFDLRLTRLLGSMEEDEARKPCVVSRERFALSMESRQVLLEAQKSLHRRLAATSVNLVFPFVSTSFGPRRWFTTSRKKTRLT